METAVYQEMARLEGQHWWFVGRRRILTQAIERMSLSSRAQILEAGSGTGGNLAMLGQFGQVTGFDPSEIARSFASSRCDFPVLDGALPFDLPFERKTFELVAALDVLEHLDDDQASLTELSHLLRPGGFMLLTVPAFPLLWGAHDEAHHHRRRYRRNTLLELVEQAGLRPIHVGHFNSILFLPAAVVRLTKRALKRDTPDMQSVPWAPINGLLTWLFSFERHFVRDVSIPFGLSLIAIAQKPASA